jgi:hypothetical protein
MPVLRDLVHSLEGNHIEKLWIQHTLLFLFVGRYKIKDTRYKIQDIIYKTYKVLKLLDVPSCFNSLQVTYNNIGVIMKQVGTTLPDYMPD